MMEDAMDIASLDGKWRQAPDDGMAGERIESWDGWDNPRR